MSEGLRGKVKGLYIGDRPGVEKTSVGLLVVSAAGIIGDRHAGLTRRSGVRDRGVPKGTELPNDRQWSAVSEEESRQIAESLGVPTVDAAWLGANLELQGIPNFSKLPAGTRLEFPHASLIVDGENIPCIGPGEVIASHYEGTETPIIPSKFVKAAWGRRGIVGFVPEDGNGTIHTDDHVKIIIFNDNQ